MKRTNVVIDEELLENARRLSGERTYSATITRALEELVKKRDFKNALAEFQAEVQKGDFFRPGYLEEIRPNARLRLSDRGVCTPTQRSIGASRQ